MIEYIKKTAAELASMLEAGRPETGEGSSIKHHFDILVEEIARLDPRDFSPLIRYEFVIKRKELQTIVPTLGKTSKNRGNQLRWKKSVEIVIKCLEAYGGEGSYFTSRAFDFVTDSELRLIIERDYNELSRILFPEAAWKSCVVMSGSILEAILWDQLTKDDETISQAMACESAPNKHNQPVSLSDSFAWTLHRLIKVAVELNILPANRADSIDQILRDYRNFIHPKKEIRAGHPCTEAEAYLAKGALDSVCNHLERLNLSTSNIPSP